MRWGLPNLVTAGRLALTPVLVILVLQASVDARVAACAVFLVAAVSDLWDGYLARSRGEITDFGKLADPLADKLLLAAALVPIYLVTRSDPALAGIPLYGHVPLWVVLVFLGREVLITALRTLVARKGTVVQARRAGKYKAFLQNIFLGAALLWLALRTGAATRGWQGGSWEDWFAFHGWFVALTLTVALALTLYSMALYLASFRGLVGDGR